MSINNKKYLRVFLSSDISVKHTRKKKRVTISFSDEGINKSFTDNLINFNEDSVNININPNNAEMAESLVNTGKAIWCLSMKPNSEIIPVKSMEEIVEAVIVEENKPETITETQSVEVKAVEHVPEEVLDETTETTTEETLTKPKLNNEEKIMLNQLNTNMGINPAKFVEVAMKAGVAHNLKTAESKIAIMDSVADVFKDSQEAAFIYHLISGLTPDQKEAVGNAITALYPTIIDNVGKMDLSNVDVNNIGGANNPPNQNSEEAAIYAAMERGRYTHPMNLPREEEEDGMVMSVLKGTAKTVAVGGLLYLGYRCFDAVFGSND